MHGLIRTSSTSLSSPGASGSSRPRSTGPAGRAAAKPRNWPPDPGRLPAQVPGHRPAGRRGAAGRRPGCHRPAPRGWQRTPTSARWARSRLPSDEPLTDDAGARLALLLEASWQAFERERRAARRRYCARARAAAAAIPARSSARPGHRGDVCPEDGPGQGQGRRGSDQDAAGRSGRRSGIVSARRCGPRRLCRRRRMAGRHGTRRAGWPGTSSITSGRSRTRATQPD